jgi:hypothetical protein
MEQYFIDAAAYPKLAATAEFMNRYDMQWIGPSPFLEILNQRHPKKFHIALSVRYNSAAVPVRKSI